MIKKNLVCKKANRSQISTCLSERASALILLGVAIAGIVLCCADAEAAVAAQITITNSIGTVGPGQAITVQCRVSNTGSTTQTFGVGAEILQGATFKADLGQRFTSTISPGSTGTVSFSYTIPTSWSDGNYTAHAVVWSGTPGGSTWLDDDSKNFTVQAVIAATITITNTIGTVAPGASISVECRVANSGSLARTFGVGAEILQGATVSPT